MSSTRPTMTVALTVNGSPYRREIAQHRLLVDFLHDDLALQGTRNGCGQGICGCCTVIIDGEPAKACLMLAAQADGCAITTIEGLASDGAPHPVQTAFVEAGAVQCGYCIPGMVLAAHALLAENPAPTDDEIREGLANNLCRCTGYVKIVDAVRLAAARGGTR
jgi:carbon-monoxide dehydrogenase small subunit